jgi:hypothetical protein
MEQSEIISEVLFSENLLFAKIFPDLCLHGKNPLLSEDTLSETNIKPLTF